jgi:MFS transporter, Spinster family, sphingosine-1-phosphate transporter
MKPDSYKKYLLVVLMLALAFNWQDRLALGLVLQDIKVDLSLSDTQLGLLTGIAFALLYSVMGIPLARWADRGNRVTLIALTVALWSLMVSLCSVAASFVQLLFIRMGVAVGEAGCMPAAHSLIPDYFSRAERPRAVSIFLLGTPLSLVTGSFLAGWLNQLYGWRMMFMLLGVPGLGLAVLVRLTLREPRCDKPACESIGRSATGPHADEQQMIAPSKTATLHEVAVTLWANRTYRQILVSFAILSFFNYGILQWQPTFFIRSYHLHTGELGSWFSLLYGFGGFVGTYLGGHLAYRYAAHDERLQLKAMAVVSFATTVLFSSSYLSRSPYTAFAFLGLMCIVGSAMNAPLFAVIQSLVPERMRAMSIALIFLCGNLIGMGLGPLTVGVASDAFRSWAGEESLRYALLLFCPGFCWAGWHFWRGSKSVMDDLAAVRVDRQVVTLEPLAGVEPCVTHSL